MGTFNYTKGKPLLPTDLGKGVQVTCIYEGEDFSSNHLK